MEDETYFSSLTAAFLLAFTYSCKPGINEENKVADTSYALIPQPVCTDYSPGNYTITENTGMQGNVNGWFCDLSEISM